jgi:hypothetical protein
MTSFFEFLLPFIAQISLPIAIALAVFVVHNLHKIKKQHGPLVIQDATAEDVRNIEQLFKSNSH